MTSRRVTRVGALAGAAAASILLLSDHVVLGLTIGGLSVAAAWVRGPAPAPVEEA